MVTVRCTYIYIYMNCCYECDTFDVTQQRRKHAWKTGKHPGQTGTKNLNLTVDSDIDLNETSYYFENGR